MTVREMDLRGRRPLIPAASNNPLGFTSNTGNDKKNTGNVTGLSNFLSGNWFQHLLVDMEKKYWNSMVLQKFHDDGL